MLRPNQITSFITQAGKASEERCKNLLAEITLNATQVIEQATIEARFYEKGGVLIFRNITNFPRSAVERIRYLPILRKYFTEHGWYLREVDYTNVKGDEYHMLVHISVDKEVTDAGT